MEKIKDERLVLQNLKNIRTAFFLQTAGILLILLYQLIVEGPKSLVANPLWILLILISTVLIYKNLLITDDVVDEKTNPGPYYRVILYAIGLASLLGLLVFLNPGERVATSMTAALIGAGATFVCTIIPFTIVHHSLKKRLENEEG